MFKMRVGHVATSSILRLGSTMHLSSSGITSSIKSPLKPSYGNFINGVEVIHSDDSIAVHNPATGAYLTKVAADGEREMSMAVAAAKEAFDDGR
jgi:hypothetical protein